MCLAKAFLKGEGEPELVMEDVALVQIEGNVARLSTIFGDRREIKAVLKEVDFDKSRIILEARG
ncbi:MAG: CooT family nickel-binding protein [Chloroflexi bacterium]|nr:CooT family nickel-binding protein [Chloroflexota bacterium]